MYFGCFDHLLVQNPKLFSMIPQQYPVRLVVGKNFFNSQKNAQGKIIVSFNCLAHLQKNTANVLPQDVSPPEIHLTVLFVHEVLKQTRNMDTFLGGIISKFSSTLSLEMFSTIKYSTVKML